MGLLWTRRVETKSGSLVLFWSGGCCLLCLSLNTALRCCKKGSGSQSGGGFRSKPQNECARETPRGLRGISSLSVVRHSDCGAAGISKSLFQSTTRVCFAIDAAWMFCLLLAVVEFARSVSEEMPFPRPATLLGFWPKWREPDRMKIVGFAMRSFSGTSGFGRRILLSGVWKNSTDKDPTFGIDTSTTTSTEEIRCAPQQRPPHPPASRAGSSIPNTRGTTRLSGFACSPDLGIIR